MSTLDAALRQHARATPRAAALVDRAVRYDYAGLDAAVQHACNELHRLGLRRGDRCALLAENSAQFVIVLYAVLRAGGIAVPINPAATVAELEYLLADCEPAIVTVDDVGSRTAALVGPAGAITRIASASGPAPSEGRSAGSAARTTPVVHLGTFAHAAHTGRHASASPQTSPALRDMSGPAGDDDSLILYTSGTTGRPKGATFDHRRTHAAARAVAQATGLTATDRLLIAAPLHHAAALGVLLFPAALVGAAAVILPSFRADKVLESLERERASVLFGVPAMYHLLLREKSLRTKDLTALRTVVFGGAAMPVAAIDQLHAALPHARLIQMCGQTEGGPGGIYSTHEQIQSRPDASGHQPMPGSEVRVVDTDDSADSGAHDGAVAKGGRAAPARSAEVGAPVSGAASTAPRIGELQLCAPSVMKGYWRDPASTIAAFADGWLRTGDIVRLDPDGPMTIIDRAKDVIITGGRNVYSAEVEQVIATHPAVANCAVTGTPDDLWGEIVTAVIELRNGATITLADLQSHCQESLSNYKVPRRLSVGEIPLTATGKADKAALRGHFAQCSSHAGSDLAGGAAQDQP